MLTKSLSYVKVIKVYAANKYRGNVTDDGDDYDDIRLLSRFCDICGFCHLICLYLLILFYSKLAFIFISTIMFIMLYSFS